MAARAELAGAAALVRAHMTGADTGPVLDGLDCREAADWLGRALAGMLLTLGDPDPDALMAALIAERMRQVTLRV